MQRTRKALVVLVALAALVTGLAVIVRAAPIVIGQFEIDGNLEDSNATDNPPFDWDTLPTAVTFDDPESNSRCANGEDDIFVGGGSTEESPNTWTFDCGSAPQKDDFLEAGIGTREIGDDTWLYLYFERKFDGGSAVLNYEFNRSDSTFVNDAGSTIPVRSTNDLLFNLEVSNGGAAVDIDVYRWQRTTESDPRFGEWILISDGSAVRGTDWDAATNAVGDSDRFTFAELAIRLQAFGVTPSCPGLGKAWVKSNSTHDFDLGVLKDRTVRKDVPLTRCGIKRWEFTLAPRGIAGATVQAVYTVEGGASRTLQLLDPEGDGTYVATDDEIPPGNVTYRFEVLNGTALIWQSAQGSEDFVAGQTITNREALTYDISLTPGDAENFADDFAGSPQPHTLTATVFQVPGGAALPNVPVSFANLGTCGSLSTTSGTTNASGETTTILTSATPCSTSVQAWVNGTASGATAGVDTGEAEATATKRFVSYDIEVSPDQTNEVGTDHTFTVTLQKDTGAGLAAIGGQTLSLALSPSTTDATITSVPGGTIGTPATTATCTTSAAGTCSVTIQKPTPGSVRLTASYTATDSDGSTVTIDDDGDKLYLDFRVSVERGGKVNEVGTSHRFIARLERDSGSGFTDLAGETLTLSLNAGGTDAEFVSVNGVSASGTLTTCTTRADDPATEEDETGTCEVVITANEPGSVSLTASWQTILASGTVERTGSARKDYVDFAISIDNGDKTNEVDTNHPFTVRLTRDTGSGPAGFANQSVDLSLDQGSTDAEFVSINGVAASGTEATCTTRADDPATTADEAGTCLVVITSSDAGTVTLTATWGDTLDSGEVTRTATARKDFVDFGLTVDGSDKVNEVGTNHPFTVRLTRDTGSGSTGLAGQTVNLSLGVGTTDARFVSINGAPASGIETTCTTRADDPATTEEDEAGTCLVVITATTPGSVTLTATWSQTLDSGTVTRTATANKQFLDFAISVTPPTSTNIVGQDHTFIVTLTRDDGTGPKGFAGETVNLSLNQGTSNAQFKTVNGASATGTSATCTTRADDAGTEANEAGSCVVVITATAPGLVTLTASWSTTLHSGTVTRSAPATKQFLAFEILVTPDDHINDVNTDHEFTVTLLRDDGTGPKGYAGQTLNLVLDPGDSDARLKTINGAPATGTTGTCTTRQDDPATEADEAGTCLVVITATTPDAVNLTATYQAASDAGAVTIEGSADKQFLDFTLEIENGDKVNSVNTEHEFIVRLKRNDGSGLAGYAGQTVSLSLNVGTTDAMFVSTNGAPATGTEATCTTRSDDPATEADEAGTCVVIITATTAGEVTLRATWQTTLDSGLTQRTATAKKTFVNFSLDVENDDKVNEVSSDHTFIVRLQRNTGEGLEGFPGQTLTLSLTPDDTEAEFVSINGADASGTEASCVTREDDEATQADEAGTCEVVITSDEPGEVELVAAWEGKLDSGTVRRRDTGHKLFVDFDLVVNPPTATNPIGVPHTFTVTLTRDEGSGPKGYAGQTVELDLDPGASNAAFTEINGAPASGTEAECVTLADDPATTDVDEAGTCVVKIISTTPGLARLVASWETELDSGEVTRTGQATKQFLDVQITVGPKHAFNRVDDPHTFVVTLTQNTGSGPKGYGGQTVQLSLDVDGTNAKFTEINGAPAAGTTAQCVTSEDDPLTPEDEGGICRATITSSLPGMVVLTATWQQEIGEATLTRTDSATKIYLAIGVAKSACPTDSSPRGGIVDYTISYSVGGANLTNATFTDTLPAGVTLVSAPVIDGVTPTTPAPNTSGGVVTWSFPVVGQGSYSGIMRVRIADGVAVGETLLNTVTLDADEITPESATHSLVVTDGAPEASGRAFGLRAEVLGSELISPTPDSDTQNPSELLAVPDPFGSSSPLVRVLGVSESDDSTAGQAAYTATASALDVDLNIPGVLRLQASSVVAKTSSQASIAGAGSSRGGSVIQDLRINGTTLGTVSEPTTILIRDPLSGEVLAEVHLLETILSGAAAGEKQPNANDRFASGMTVNGIHVVVRLLDLADVIVSHAETSAAFDSGLGCGAHIRSVSGSGHALGINLKPDSEGGIDLGSVRVAQVDLPITGGKDDATLAGVNVPGVVAANAAEAHTSGSISGDSASAQTESHVAHLDLLNGAITATAIQAKSASDSATGSVGEARIVGLELNGTDVCAALGLGSICTPAPNTELLIPGGPTLVVLNEQIPEPGGLTVNAVHIWVLGKGNPFGLPVGAEIVIANAHSDAHPAQAIVVDNQPFTMSMKALSSPSANRPKLLEVPRTYRVPDAISLAPVLDTPAVSIPEIVRDPVAVLDTLEELPLAEEVLEDAKELLDTLTDPEALLQAIADPQSLLEGLEDPDAALDALMDAAGIEQEETVSEEAEQPG